MELKKSKSDEIEFEVPDEALKEVVNAKLSSFDMDPLDKLVDKTIKRLLETEFFIQYSHKHISHGMQEIKDNLVSKSNLDKSGIITCSRKTFYNDDVLRKYIEKSIDNEEDYFNSKVLKKTQENYNKLQTLYDNLYPKVIDKQNLKVRIKELEQELEDLYEEKDNLLQCIEEKDNEISELRSKLRSCNIVKFKSK